MLILNQCFILLEIDIGGLVSCGKQLLSCLVLGQDIHALGIYGRRQADDFGGENDAKHH